MTQDDSFRGFYPGSKHALPPLEAPIVPALQGKPDTPWDSKPIRKTVAGREVEFFTIGAVAAALNKSAVSIRVWIREGHLPQATFRLPEKNKVQGRRLYTRGQIEALIAVAQRHGLMDHDRVRWERHPSFAADVRQAWADLPT